MNIREIREQLGRVKTYYLRNETLRSVGSLVAALRGLGASPAPMDIRGSIREAVQLLARDPKLMECLTAPLVYQSGQEKAVLVLLAPAYKLMQEAENFENHDNALNRKVQLDQALNLGMRHLEQKRVSEADAEFARAISFYKDEHRLFYLIAKALMEAGEVRRAYPYAKKSVELQPDLAEVQALHAEIHRQRVALSSAS